MQLPSKQRSQEILIFLQNVKKGISRLLKEFQYFFKDQIGHFVAFIYLEACTCQNMCVEVRRQIVWIDLSFYHEDPKNQIQVIWLIGSHPRHTELSHRPIPRL